MRKKLLTGMAAGLFLWVGAPSQAGTFVHNLNSDPSADITFVGDARWVDTGSFDGTGYISLTDAENSKLASIILPDFDQGGSISSFQAKLKLRMGGGTVGGTIADGFSFNLTSPDDPDLVSGTAVGEEGTTTGLVIALDTFDNGSEAPALDVKLDNVLIARARAVGPSTLLDPIFADAQGRGLVLDTPGVDWADLVINLNADGALTVSWKGLEIFTNLPTGYRGRPGRFMLGARTGGVNANHWVDNIDVTTSTATAGGPHVSAFKPRAHGGTGSRTSIELAVTDGATALDPATINLKLDGATVAHSVAKQGTVSTVSFAPAELVVGSTHTVELSYSDNGNPAAASSYSFRFWVSSPFAPNTLFIEAEDFNFGHGLWIKDRPIGMTGVYPGGDYQDLGDGIDGTVGDGSDLGIDYFEVNKGNDQAVYRPGTGVEAGKRNGPAGLNRLDFDVQINHVVGWSDAGDWLNFTRQFPALAVGKGYKVYARLASGGADEAAQLDLVTSGATTTTQTLTKLGEFRAPATGGWDTWHLVPLKDSAGNETFIKISGERTLRFTVLPGNLDFDYLAFVPTDVPALLPPAVSSTTPAANSFAAPDQTITVVITDRDTKVVANTIKLFVDDVDVTSASTITDTAEGATISYKPATLFPPNSSHKFKLTFEDNDSPPQLLVSEVNFAVGAYKIVPGSSASKPGDVNTALPGFRARIHQMAIQRFPGDANLSANAERQLANGYIDPATGQPYENLADLSSAEADGIFNVPDFINWTGDPTEAGNFTTGNGFTDQPIPGIPGSTGSTDSIAAEILTFLDLAAGTYRFGVNSDDGFKVTVGPNPRDAFSPVLGIFDGGRGAADTLFDFYVEASGIYPFRLTWWEGTGGANVEFFMVDTSTGTRTLINNRDAANHVKAYRESSSNPAYVSRLVPAVDQRGVDPDTDIIVELTDAKTIIDSSSVQITLDGNPVNAVVNKNGGVTTATVATGVVLAPLSVHTATLSYKHGSPAETVNQTWTFTVANFPTLPIGIGSAPGSGTASQPGFLVKIHQVDAGAESFNAGDPQNRISRAESQLRGLAVADGGGPRPNVADLSGAGTDGLFTITGLINWSGDGDPAGPDPAGNFNANNNYPDGPIPGIPGTTGHTDYIAGELRTYVEFPTAGIYRMGVNSDDGFRVSPAEAGGRDGVIHIDSPADISGPIYTIEAGSNWAVPLVEIGSVSGEVVLADPLEGCQALVNAEAVKGKIVLMYRGTCRFDNKAAHAKKAGAIGVIISQILRAGQVRSPLEMGGDPTLGALPILGQAIRIDIPVTMVPLPDGDKMKAKLSGGTKVMVKMGYETTTLGSFDAGRGASDTIFTFNVPQAGVYPFRCVWYEGGGGANLEWFSVTRAGDRVLLNDVAQGGLKTFRARTFTQPRPEFTVFRIQGGNLHLEWTGGGTLELSDQVTGPWVDTGLTSPVEGAIDRPARFGRIKR
jgi:hypothetical protein